MLQFNNDKNGLVNQGIKSPCLLARLLHFSKAFKGPIVETFTSQLHYVI